MPRSSASEEGSVRRGEYLPSLPDLPEPKEPQLEVYGYLVA